MSLGATDKLRSLFLKGFNVINIPLTFYLSQVEMNRNELPDAFVMMYSVIDKTSFKTTEDELARLQNWDALRFRVLIVVGNKIDLVRSRAVSTQGKLKLYRYTTRTQSGAEKPACPVRSWLELCLFTFKTESALPSVNNRSSSNPPNCYFEMNRHFLNVVRVSHAQIFVCLF